MSEQHEYRFRLTFKGGGQIVVSEERISTPTAFLKAIHDRGFKATWISAGDAVFDPREIVAVEWRCDSAGDDCGVK